MQLLAIQSELHHLSSLFFDEPFDDDLRFWSLWFCCSSQLDVFFMDNATNLGQEMYCSVRREVELRQLPLPYGALLSGFLLVREAVVKSGGCRKTLGIFDEAFDGMFDSGLRGSSFDAHLHSGQGEVGVSSDCVIGLITLVQQGFQGREQLEIPTSVIEELVSICQRYLQFLEKRKKHLELHKQRLAKSESCRLEMASVEAHNKALIQQYIRHVQVPEFAKTMLMDYWSIKMSIAQSMGDNAIHNWQFYWTFVARITRYFKASGASTRSQVLNDDFEFLHDRFLEELSGEPPTFESSKFRYQLREFHLLRLESVRSMQKSKRMQKPSKVTLEKSDAVASRAELCASAEPETPIQRGALLWMKVDELCVPCEVLLAPESICSLPDKGSSRRSKTNSVSKICRAQVYILAFDGGKGTLTFDKAQFHDAFQQKILFPRKTAQDRYHRDVSSSVNATA